MYNDAEIVQVLGGIYRRSCEIIGAGLVERFRSDLSVVVAQIADVAV